MNLAAWIMGLAWPVVTRILFSLGIGFVTFGGLAEALHTLLGGVKANMAGMTGDVAGLVQLSGFGDALSVIAGGMIASLTFVATTKLMKATT